MRGQKNTGEVKKQGGGSKKTRAPYTFIKYHAPVRRNHAPVQRNTSCIIIGPKISYIYIYTYVYIYIYIYIVISACRLPFHSPWVPLSIMHERSRSDQGVSIPAAAGRKAEG